MTEEEIIDKFERENITLASLPSRFYAYIVDELLVSLLFILIYMDYMPKDASMEDTIGMINSMVMYVMLIKIVYQAFFVHMYGATLGKILLKIKVISIEDIENPSLLHSTSRSVIRVLSESFFYIGFIWALLNPKKETWHDKFGKTLVVNVF